MYEAITNFTLVINLNYIEICNLYNISYYLISLVCYSYCVGATVTHIFSLRIIKGF